MTTRRDFIKALAAIPPVLCIGESWAANNALNVSASGLAQAIELNPGGQASQLLQTSVSPCSAGRYLLGRKFSVGDEAVMRITDIFSNVETGTLTLKVTRVDVDAGRVELNEGEWVMDLMGNIVRTPQSDLQDSPQQIVPAELQLGKKWIATWLEQGPGDGTRKVELDMSIVAFEKLRIAAGEFDAFRIEGHGWFNNKFQISRRYWISPGINFALRYEHLRAGPLRGRSDYAEADRYELVSLRQQAMDTACAARSGRDTRTLVIKSS
ncbi:MAG: hypothetical protein IV108_06795 [Burkholderiales bacterium]|nr:hypothetical protein [Burkholderiales bacterium]